jgi:small GTP-binding protein
VVDDVIVSHTHFDGTPVVDITAHGGVRVVERILQVLDRLGFPLAEAGEGQGAAWPADNLIEREATRLMVCAKTGRAVRFLAWQRRHLVPSLEALEAESQSDPSRAGNMLKAMIARYRASSLLTEGATIAIIGPPNSGKSTLFNCLVGRSAAIVSEGAGTTRDWLAQAIEVDGVPLTLVDTAGHRTSTDDVERAAVEAGRQMAERADLCLLLFDGSAPVLSAGSALWVELGSSLQRALVVGTKLDLGTVWKDLPPLQGFGTGQLPFVRVSAVSEAGLEELCQQVLGLLGLDERVDNTPCLFTECQVEAAKQALAAGRHGWAATQNIIAERLISA